MRILVACEFSRIVSEVFENRGHKVTSCDLLPAEKEGEHYQGNVFNIIDDGWDMMLAFPPCTHLAASGARWFKYKVYEQEIALNFVRGLLAAPISKIVLENPIGVISTYIRKPNQIIQPWMFGEEKQKATCLWLEGLPVLRPTNIVGKGEFITFSSGKKMSAWYSKLSTKRSERSRTFQGIANAMAEQWG